ncbi:MAG: hypothetical protein EOO03_14910 [Chitinophagaceae bacterium]|nr:MAG: hypothetical protein EOO03_14910 [Chitinophagaceae bacterium]
MKKLVYILMLSASFAACKSKQDLNTNKDLVLLTDSSYNSSYLTDTGAVANSDMYDNGGEVVSGKATVPVRSTPSRSSSANSGGSTGSSSAGSGSSGSGTTASAPAKKGISKAAKGAIIGGVGGAVAGAVIGKSGKGAIIGGAVGAAGGYIIGRSKDRKDGRVGN